MPLRLAAAEQILENRGLGDAAIEAADRYYPAFDFMVRGNKKPQEAIEACLFETVGNA